MWYDQPFRNSGNLTILLRAIRKIATFPIHIMEVCGGQTYALSRYRIEDLLPETIQMIHGPGCPVCVTAEETVARAIEIARFPDTIFCTFGDMMRVPSAEGWNLQRLKAEGKDIRMLYSPLALIFSAIVGALIKGGFFGLFISAYARREAPVFAPANDSRSEEGDSDTNTDTTKNA